MLPGPRDGRYEWDSDLRLVSQLALRPHRTGARARRTYDLPGLRAGAVELAMLASTCPATDCWT